MAQECSGTSERAILHFSFLQLVHPLSAIPGATMARDLVLIVLKIKLVVVGQLQETETSFKNELCSKICTETE